MISEEEGDEKTGSTVGSARGSSRTVSTVTVAAVGTMGSVDSEGGVAVVVECPSRSSLIIGFNDRLDENPRGIHRSSLVR